VIRKLLRKFRRRGTGEINPDEIFIDSSNLPQFDTHQFEGRFEQPISRRTIAFVSVFFMIIGGVFLSRFWFLQINNGEVYAKQSEMNRLDHIDIFANRGVIYDRNGVVLASNAKYEDGAEFARREYGSTRGVAHLIGYVKYPTKDSAGFYFRNSYLGEDGIEKIYHDTLSGKNGVRIVETDALGKIQSQSVVRPPKDGESVTLTVDSRIHDKMYEVMEKSSLDYGFTGGAAVIMDVTNGDLISLVSFPEYSSAVMAEGVKEEIAKYQTSPQTPFLNRAVSGLYTPGSIVKPIVAIGALAEGIISPTKKILSTGSISIPNPYFPDNPTVFRDWKAHGWVDMKDAIAVSSNVYFFSIGGGFEDQGGLGISKIEQYFRMFGLGEKTGLQISHEKDGVIPNPEWKKEVFDGDDWRVGDTYNTSIGQYGLLFTPIQIARYVSAIANDGILLKPRLVNNGEIHTKTIPLGKESFRITKEGMRQSVTGGTVAGLNVPYVSIAGKTGTAELGSRKEFVNSWTVGYFPYEEPRYAFAVLMEKGPRSNLVGATFVMRQVLDWMHENTPEYFE
jgi:penicillin-binding protein 2